MKFKILIFICSIFVISCTSRSKKVSKKTVKSEKTKIKKKLTKRVEKKEYKKVVSDSFAVERVKLFLQSVKDQKSLKDSNKNKIDFLRKSELLISRSNITEKRKEKKVDRILFNATKRQRFDFLKDFPLGDIVVSPGYSIIKKIYLVDELKKKIEESNNFKHNPLLLNIVVDANGEVRDIDLWNNHERMLAYLESGKKKIGDIGIDNQIILINGKDANRKFWSHLIKKKAFDSRIKLKTKDISGGNNNVIKVNGRYSNYDLGSRTTVKKMQENSVYGKIPKLLFVFDHFDPIHEGYFKTTEKIKRYLKIDEVIFVPKLYRDETITSKSTVHRLKMLEMRLKDVKGISLYLGNLKDKKTANELMFYLSEQYATYHVHQLHFSEEAKYLLEQDAITASSFVHHVVIPENNFDLRNFEVPKHLMGVMEFLRIFNDGLPISSRDVKSMIIQGKRLDEDIIKKNVLRYILDHGIYQRRRM